MSKINLPLLIAAAFLSYLGVSYLVVPAFWQYHERHKKLGALPMVTVTANGIPGDAINVGLVGKQRDVLCAMREAGWDAADAVTLKSSLEISASVLLDRPYHRAPVSPLFYVGRRQDLAFEKPVGNSADRRHHVRLWMVLQDGDEDRPLWLGAATFDRGVGLSHTTGQITHHIAPDIDADRDLIQADLQAAGMVSGRYRVTGLGPTLFGRNGGGDRYYTDGDIWVSELVEECSRRTEPPVIQPSPAPIEFKNNIWKSVADLFRNDPR